MKRILLALASAAVLGAPAFALAAAEQTPAQELPVDKATVVQGVEVACTGMAETRLDPKWTAFPVRVEFSNGKAEYLTDAEIRVTTAKGKPVLHVSCAAPWVLLKTPPGQYHVFARLLSSEAKERSAPFTTPKTGQIRVVLAFPDAETAPQ
jgi:hypothetical protein